MAELGVGNKMNHYKRDDWFEYWINELDYFGRREKLISLWEMMNVLYVNKEVKRGKE